MAKAIPAKKAAKPKAKQRVTEEAPVRKKKKAATSVEKSAAPRKAKATAAPVKEKVKKAPVKEELEAKATEVDRIHQMLDDQLDGIEKNYSLNSSSVSSNETRLSTGLLTLDLILGKGIVPGWYTVFGPEQSCKSTGATTFMGAALNSNVPITAYFDFEGSFSPDYASNIFKLNGVNDHMDQVFGLRDPKSGGWTVKPRVRYYSEGVAEKFFDYVAKLERILPDKVNINDQWYYVYEDTKENRKIVGNDYDANYLRKTGKLRIPASDSSLQAFIILDSYPAMLPEKQDVDDPGSAMAMQARMFSEQIKRIKGKLRSKRIAIVGVNQLRLRPAVMFGNPEYEPGGEALKFFSDVRLKFSPRALSGVPDAKGKGYIEEEDSASGEGTDEYRYIHVRAQKNKLSAPNLEGWLRVWIKNADGEGMGFDPVWDVWRYLKETRQVEGKRNQMKFTIAGHESKKSMSWNDFKIMVTGKFSEIKAICESAGLKPFRIREFCTKQLASGKGLELYFAAKKAGAKAEDDEAEAGDD